jgi:hypothetical protein
LGEAKGLFPSVDEKVTATAAAVTTFDIAIVVNTSRSR